MQLNLQMDFTVFLDGGFCASSARRTTLAVGEPGSSTCTAGVPLAVLGVVG